MQSDTKIINNEITIILTLKDRDDYTKMFFKYSYSIEFIYLVLDGSFSNKNENFIKNINLPNIQYYRFPPDKDYRTYIDKTMAGLLLVKTKYLIRVDNDDILLFQGIKKAISKLNLNENAIGAGSNLIGFQHKSSKDKFTTFPIQISKQKNFTSSNRLEAVNESRQNYGVIWNSVFRTNTYKKAIEFAAKMSYLEAHLFEFVVTDYLLSSGRLIFTRTPHYLRLTNQQNRAVSVVNPDFKKEFKKKEWLVQIHAQDNKIAKLIGIDIAELQTNQNRIAILNGIGKKPNILTKVYRKFTYYLPKTIVPVVILKILVRLRIYLPML